MEKLLLDSWGLPEAPAQHKAQGERELTLLLGPTATTFSSQQRALEAALHVLRVDEGNLCVLLPVNAPRWIMNAVHHAGGLPVFIDVDENMLINHSMAMRALDELGEGVVIFWRPLGRKLSEAHLNLALTVASIQVSPIFPRQLGNTEFESCTFSLYDLSPLCSVGAVLYAPFKDLLNTLRTTKDEIGDNLSTECAAKALRRLPEADKRFEHVQQIAKQYRKAFNNIEVDTVTGADTLFIERYYPIWVNDAKFSKLHLLSNEIESNSGFCMLEYGVRFTRARRWDNTVLYLPCHPGLSSRDVATIVLHISATTRQSGASHGQQSISQ